MLKFSIICILFFSCADTASKGEKYTIVIHIEQKDSKDLQYQPKNININIIENSDSAAYLKGVSALISEKQILKKLEAEGIKTYKKIIGFTVKDSVGNDIKTNLNPFYIQKMDDFIKSKTDKEGIVELGN